MPVRGELRFRDGGGDELILADAWNGPLGLAQEASEVPVDTVLPLLAIELRRNRAVAQALRELLACVEGGALPLRGLGDQQLLERVERELSGIAPSLRALRAPRARLVVPAPLEFPRQEDAPDANALTFIDFDLVNQDGEPIPFLSYELEFPEGVVKRGRLDEDGHLHVGEIPAGNYKIRFPQIDFVVEPDPNTAFIDIELVDTVGRPVINEPYEITLPDGRVLTGTLDRSGRAHVSGLPVDVTAKVTFPNLSGAGAADEAASEEGTLDERLESTFALDEVTLLATELTEYGFCVWMTRIFGEDVPLGAYRQLYASLRDQSFVAPPLVIVETLPGGHVAGYNLQAHQIEITREALIDARSDNEACWDVMAALVEEMGHHIDDHLRNTLSNVGGDAQLDEGAVFGYALLSALSGGEPRVNIGVHHDDAGSHELQLDLTEFSDHLDEVLGQWQQNEDARTDHYEYFGAGEGNHANPGHSFGHASIERALARPFFNKERATTPAEIRELKEIYFGNWLRDYSQAVTDKTVRPPGAPADAPGNSAEALTQIVDVLARQHFQDIPTFRVTTENLGVYRYEEHIDNPFGLGNASAIEPRLNEAPLPAENLVNPASWLMSYIDGSVAGRKSAVAYMSEQLRLAVSSGRTSEGRRHFGAALHVLEDYYAHSNFVELTLRSRGHTDVFPWSATVPVGQGVVTPVVTGIFGSDDTAASLMYVIGEHMAQDADCTAGRRGPGAEIALILLRDRDPQAAERAEAALANIEAFQRANPRFFEGYCYTMDFLFGWSGQLIGHGLHGSAALIDDAQTEFINNLSTSTNPTHSQIAKDHDDHPLHVLAARCAMHAVGVVGRAMLDAWSGRANADHVVGSATKFFIHPQHPNTASADADVRALIMLVDAWGRDAANASTIARLSSASILQHLQTTPEHAHAREQTRRVIRQGQELRHSTRPEAPPDVFDALIDELLQLVGSE